MRTKPNITLKGTGTNYEGKWVGAVERRGNQNRKTVEEPPAYKPAPSGWQGAGTTLVARIAATRFNHLCF